VTVTQFEPDRGLACRRLMRRQTHAALATNFAGRPYASLVALAFDLDASPLLLLSDLAQHTSNIVADKRVSLLFGEDGGDHLRPLADRLAAPRLPLIGEAERCDDPRLRGRFVARHPRAASYAGFGDFHLYRVSVERGHLIAGFGRIAWLDRAALRLPTDAGALAAAEGEILAHMNTDHAEALALYAARLLRRRGAGWRMTGIDPEGIDLRRASRVARLDFAAPVLTPAAARQALIELTHQAQAASDD